MPIASRISDLTVHGGTVVTGSPDVMIGGMPAARVDDGHVCPIHPGGPVAQGSATVLINNRPAARMGDKLMCVPGAAPAPGLTAKAGGKYDNKYGKSEQAYGDDAKKQDEKKPAKPEFKAEVKAKLAEAKAEGSVATFADDHVKLLTGKASADVTASAQIKGVRDMKAELAASASASGSVVQVSGTSEGQYGKVSGSADVLTAEAKAKVGASIDTKKGEGSLGAEVGAGAAVFKGKVEGETKGWRIPFTDWEIGLSGGVEGTLLGVEAKAHAGISYSKEEGFRMGAGAKVSAFLAGLGINIGIFVRPIKKEQKPAPDALATGHPTVSIGDDELKEKKQRLAQRQALIDQARATAADPATSPEDRAKLQAAADRLERNNVAVERARLSEHVYKTDQEGGPPPPPTGWSQLSDEELQAMGIRTGDPGDLVDSSTGYKAAIYRSELEDPPTLVVAFAGTDDAKDAVTDVRQGVGMQDPQYDNAMALTRTVAQNAPPGYTVETTGHSLGGGLASAGSAVSGVRGNTFNAAGLHRRTTRRNYASADRAGNEQNVNAYHNTSDPLNNFQDAVGLAADAYGNRIPIAPASEHEHSWLELFTRGPITAVKDMALDGHGIGTMVDAIEAQKVADVMALGGPL